MAGQSIRNFSPEESLLPSDLRTTPRQLPFGKTVMSAYPFDLGFDHPPMRQRSLRRFLKKREVFATSVAAAGLSFHFFIDGKPACDSDT